MFQMVKFTLLLMITQVCVIIRSRAVPQRVCSMTFSSVGNKRYVEDFHCMDKDAEEFFLQKQKKVLKVWNDKGE